MLLKIKIRERVNSEGQYGRGKLRAPDEAKEKRKWPREILGERRAGFSPPRVHAAIFFLAVFFRVKHDGLSERTTVVSFF